MKKILLSLFLILSSLPAYAEPAALFMKPVPSDLIDWVERQTRVPLPRDEKIAVVDNGEKMLVANVQGILHAAGAAYQNGQIYFPVRTAVHFQDPEIQALMIHELTHLAQDRGHKFYHCDGQREAEAYRSQNDWLVTQGLPPALDQDAVERLDACGEI